MSSINTQNLGQPAENPMCKAPCEEGAKGQQPAKRKHSGQSKKLYKPPGIAPINNSTSPILGNVSIQLTSV